MGMRMKVTSYNAPTPQILATPDHYVAIGFKHPRATATEIGNAILEEGRYIVKAGTIYPANDATAIGVVLNDYDVTDGDAQLAVVVHGFIKTAALPVEPDALAIGALKQINFIKAIIPTAPILLPKVSIISGAHLVESDTNAGTLADGEIRIKVEDGKFKNTVAKSDITIINLPTGMDYIVTYINATEISIEITGAATQHEAINSTELTITIAKEVIEDAIENEVITGISIAFTNAPELGKCELRGDATKVKVQSTAVPEPAIFRLWGTEFIKENVENLANWTITEMAGIEMDGIGVDTITLAPDNKTIEVTFKFIDGYTHLINVGELMIIAPKLNTLVIDPKRDANDYIVESVVVLETVRAA